jgi:hypothetical protein
MSDYLPRWNDAADDAASPAQPAQASSTVPTHAPAIRAEISTLMGNLAKHLRRIGAMKNKELRREVWSLVNSLESEGARVAGTTAEATEAPTTAEATEAPTSEETAEPTDAPTAE